MSTVLIYTSPARGHLYPIMPAALELGARGHRVSVRTLASEVELVRARGVDAEPIDPKIEALPHTDHAARGTLGKVRSSLRTFMERAPLDAADLQRAIGAEQPDMLLVDGNAWGAVAAAEASGLPYALWVPFLLPLPSRGAPPWGPGLAPLGGPAGRLRDAVVRRVADAPFSAIVLGPLNTLRGELGLAPVAAATEPYLRSPLLLSLTAEPFEYAHPDWPASVRLVGPGEWEPDPDASAPVWLEDDQRPLVLVTLSSEFQDDARLLQTALDALEHEPVRVVATSVGTDPAAFRVPSNARVERFLPHGPLLDRAACVVCHGGLGITQKALARGVPAVVVAFGRDQPETARRVQLAGAGVRLPPSRLTSRRLRTAVRQATEMRPGAQRVAAGFAAAGGAPAAADAVEALLTAPR